MSCFSRFGWAAMTAICVALVPGIATADSLSIPIAAALDDHEENLDTGAMDAGSSDLELNTEGPPDPRQAVGLRFTNLAIPAGSTITSAWVQFMVDEADDEDTSVRIYGELAANSAQFSDSPFSITPRTKTANSVVWADIPLWTNEGDAGADQRTPDLASVIQEIVNQGGWASGNALSLIIVPEPLSDNSGERTAISYEKSSTSGGNQHPAILNIEFQPVPEPATCLLAALAAVGLFVLCRRQ